jgi:hypothetical protein
VNRILGHRRNIRETNAARMAGIATKNPYIPVGEVCSHGRGRRFDPCIAHQPVRASLGGFRLLKVPRHSRRLETAHAVCERLSGRSHDEDDANSPKVSARIFSFPGEIRCIVLRVGAALQFADDLGGSIGLSGRFQPQRGPLLRPFHWQVHQPRHTEAAGKTSLRRRRYDRRRDKSQRQCHANGAFALALPIGQHLSAASGIPHEFVKPTMGRWSALLR